MDERGGYYLPKPAASPSKPYETPAKPPLGKGRPPQEEKPAASPSKPYETEAGVPAKPPLGKGRPPQAQSEKPPAHWGRPLEPQTQEEKPAAHWGRPPEPQVEKTFGKGRPPQTQAEKPAAHCKGRPPQTQAEKPAASPSKPYEPEAGAPAKEPTKLTICDEKSLCHDLNQLVNNPDLSDITFLIGNVKIYSIRVLLAARSKVFRAMLFGKLQEGISSEIKINDPHTKPDAFLSLMQFLYTGSVEISPKNALHVLYLAKFYDVESLRERCGKIVKGMISDEDVWSVWDSALVLGEEDISKACKDYVVSNTGTVFEVANLKNVSKDVLLKVVASDILDIEEIECFKFVKKWIEVHNQQPKQIIDEIISYIRFPLISSKDIVEVVMPTNLIADKVLLEAFAFQASPGTFDVESKIQFKSRIFPFVWVNMKDMGIC